MKEFSHADLVELGAAWLRKQKWPVVITDVVSGSPETPDVIGFKTGGSVLLEAKASRSDFLRDKKKHFRMFPEEGMGDDRFFVCAPGIVTAEDVPEGWGLLVPNSKGTGLRCRLKPPGRAFYNRPRGLRSETKLLVSLIRRMGQAAPNGVSVSVYVYDNEKARGTVGVLRDVKSIEDGNENEGGTTDEH